MAPTATKSSTGSADRRAVPRSSRTTNATGLLAAIEAIASFVADFESSVYSGEDAATLVAAFSRAERLCNAGKTLAATRAAESNRHAISGHRNAAEWLAQQTGESVGEAVDLLKLGQALEGQPEVGRAYRDGKLSRSRARLVSGAVKVNPRSEHELIGGAEQDTFRQLKERCLRAKTEGRSAEDAAKAYAAIHRSRSCRTWTDADGAFRLDALLTPDVGATLLASLTGESNRVFQQARKAGLEESPAAYAADALVALVTGQSAKVSDQSPAGRPGAESAAPRAAEARPGQDGRQPPSATVHLRVDLDALRRGSVDEGEVCEIPGVGPVPIESARALMGDAITELVITNGVDVTTVCHLGRSIPRPLRTALLERDRTCVVPGCDVRQGLEIDHWQISFADGGPATLENLARLCRHHHHQRTHEGFVLHGGPGRWGWEAPKRPKVPKPTARGKGGGRRPRSPLRT